MARQGQAVATRNAVVAMLNSAGINENIARAFGFQERIVQAQIAYVHGAQVGIHEADIANALNNVGNALNTPAWSRTSAAEIRRVRVLNLMLYPNLLLSHIPVAKGQTPNLLDDSMSPLEALQIAMSLIDQKLFNPEFQFTSSETTQVVGSRDAVLRLSAKRGGEFRAALYGSTGSRSVRDMLWVADGFFTDLKLNAVTGVAR